MVFGPERFEDVLFVTVSSTPDVRVIVQRILEHKNYNVPVFASDKDAVNIFKGLLKSESHRRILLVLDDVWSESLVDEFKFDLPNYKLLVTSRSELSRVGSPFYLNPLTEEAALSLFRSCATRGDGEPSFYDERRAKKVHSFILVLTYFH